MKDSKEYKFVVTGGHLTPAQATIHELNKRGYRNITWFGRKKTMAGDKTNSAEFEVVKNELKLQFEDIITGKIIRFDNIKTFLEFILNIVKIPLGVFQAFFLLLKYRPDIIISFGGYVAVPVVLSGELLGIPSVTHEQTVVTGMANKFITKLAKKVLISWEDSKNFFDKKKTVLTGNPVRKEIFEVVTDLYHINKKLKTIYVTGGNQGAHIINNAVVEILEDLLKEYNVIHQTGVTSITGDFERCSKLEKSLTGKTKGNYIVKGTTYGPQIGEVFSKADLVISRSGANICSDILALGKLSILIPIPWSNQNEQFLNAQVLKKLGIGTIIEENKLSPDFLLEKIHLGMRNLKEEKDFNGNELEKTIDKSKKMINPEAAGAIVDEILEVIGDR